MAFVLEPTEAPVTTRGRFRLEPRTEEPEDVIRAAPPPHEEFFEKFMTRAGWYRTPDGNWVPRGPLEAVTSPFAVPWSILQQYKDLAREAVTGRVQDVPEARPPEERLMEFAESVAVPVLPGLVGRASKAAERAAAIPKRVRVTPEGWEPAPPRPRLRIAAEPDVPLPTAAKAPKLAVEAEAKLAAGVPKESIGKFFSPGYYYGTILGQLEKLGPEGAEMSRLIQKSSYDTYTWFARNIMPAWRQTMRLNPAQQARFIQTVEGKLAPTAELAEALTPYQRVFSTQGVIAREAPALGIRQYSSPRKTVPWAPLENYYPREYPRGFVERLGKKGALESQSLEALVKSGQARNRAEAAWLLRRFTKPERRIPGLEFPREVDLPGYITNPAEAISIRGWKVAKRFAELQNYGHRDEVVASLIRQMELRDPQAAARAQSIWNLLNRRDPVYGDLNWLFRKATGFQAAVRLPLAAVVNLSQPAQIALRTNLRTATRSLLRVMLHPRTTRADAREIGAFADMIAREMNNIQAIERGYLQRFNPYRFVEQFVRTVGTAGGRIWADKVAGMVAKGGVPDSWLGRELKRLLFSNEEIAQVLASRKLSPEQMQRIAWAITDQTQFFTYPARRSEFFLTPLGMLTGIFKGFGINAGRLLKKTFYDELRAGNPLPMARLLAMLPIGIVFGEAFADARALLRRSERPSFHNVRGIVERSVDNLLTIGGFGLATDFLAGTARMGWQGAVSFVAGPALTDAAKAADNTLRLVFAEDQAQFSQRVYTMARFLVGLMPLAGPFLSSTMRPPTGPKKRWGPAERLGFSERRQRYEQAQEAKRRGLHLREWRRTQRYIFEDNED